ncbi:MAG: CRISPR-associated helicase Cas3' [Cyclobacteriaceae bacterium]|nr:CRISPR-associated helicase Cas3' [Cyclobacteriaceae bacterium]
MIFYSHGKTDDNGIVFGSKKLADHISGVLDKANFHYSSNLDLGLSEEELKSLLKIIVQFHDLGKYTSYFQNYLLKKPPIDGILKQHAKVGGLSAFNFLRKYNEKQALVALFVIFQHHSQLIDILKIGEKLNDNLVRIIGYQKEDLKKTIPQIEVDLKLENLVSSILYPEEKEIRRGLKIWILRNQTIKDYFLINYLFSLLIEADKLDASDTVQYALKSIQYDSVDCRYGGPDTSIQALNLNNLSKLDNNELRNFCRFQVISNLENQDILDQYLFTLTAPTGIGKTMTALDFALKLKAKVREKIGIEARIIYALPFINIIEQALKEYKQTLPDEINILAHYQYADVFGDKEEKFNEDGAENLYTQRLMAYDTWQADIVITSFVQFFETLIGNRNKLLKKFNHYAHAIIILDEVQTLRIDHMPLIGAALFYLSKFLKARIILMTATKPKIFELAQEQILTKEGEKVQPYELLKPFNEVFAAFQRTRIVPLLNTDLDKKNLVRDFVQKVFSEKWDPEKSCIIVCNTVNRSIDIYNSIITYLEEEGFENQVEYLSTNIIPAHRFERIKNIQDQINLGRAPILVSTQVVEAGVDLDFDIGFRDIGPIDSIIQVAGRINRNNNANKKNAPLYIIDFGDGQKIYGRITYDQAKSALQSQAEFTESEYLNLINKYFDELSDKKSFSRFNKIFESMKMLRYDSENKEEDRPVSSFKIIEESRTTQAVFIEIAEEETMLREKHLAKIKNEISKEEFEKNYKQSFQQRIITVPDYLTKELPFINDYEENLKAVNIEVADKCYDLKTGFKRKQDEAVWFF